MPSKCRMDSKDLAVMNKKTITADVEWFNVLLDLFMLSDAADIIQINWIKNRACIIDSNRFSATCSAAGMYFPRK